LSGIRFPRSEGLAGVRMAVIAISEYRLNKFPGCSRACLVVLLGRSVSERGETLSGLS
jgi:hypothetical protein